MGSHLSVNFTLLQSILVFCRNFIAESKLYVEHGKLRIVWVVNLSERKE